MINVTFFFIITLDNIYCVYRFFFNLFWWHAYITPLSKIAKLAVLNFLTYYHDSALRFVCSTARLGWWIPFHDGSFTWQPKWVPATGWWSAGLLARGLFCFPYGSHYSLLRLLQFSCSVRRSIPQNKRNRSLNDWAHKCDPTSHLLCFIGQWSQATLRFREGHSLIKLT